MLRSSKEFTSFGLFVGLPIMGILTFVWTLTELHKIDNQVEAFKNRSRIAPTQNIGPAFPEPDNMQFLSRGPRSNTRNSNIDGKH